MKAIHVEVRQLPKQSWLTKIKVYTHLLEKGVIYNDKLSSYPG